MVSGFLAKTNTLYNTTYGPTPYVGTMAPALYA